jgi:uncharacterized protein
VHHVVLCYIAFTLNNMTNAKPLKLNCPTCSKIVLWTDDFPDRPFCSNRCKLIDLGEWASENRRIPGAPADPLGSGNDWDDLD